MWADILENKNLLFIQNRDHVGENKIVQPTLLVGNPLISATSLERHVVTRKYCCLREPADVADEAYHGTTHPPSAPRASVRK